MMGSDAFELRDDLLFRSGGQQAHDHDGDAAGDKGGQKLIDVPRAAERTHRKLPDEDHDRAGEHSGDRSLLVAALPEQGKQHHGAECRAEAGPGKGNDTEDGAVGIHGEEHGDHRDADDAETGNEEVRLFAELQAEDVVQQVLRDAGLVSDSAVNHIILLNHRKNRIRERSEPYNPT